MSRTIHTEGVIKKITVPRINDIRDWYVYNDKRNGQYTDIGTLRKEYDADLLMEALNALNESDLTPAQLLETVKELKRLLLLLTKLPRWSKEFLMIVKDATTYLESIK